MKDTARKLAYLNTENKQKEEKTFPENLNHKPVHEDMQSDSSLEWSKNSQAGQY